MHLDKKQKKRFHISFGIHICTEILKFNYFICVGMCQEDWRWWQWLQALYRPILWLHILCWQMCKLSFYLYLKFFYFGSYICWWWLYVCRLHQSYLESSSNNWQLKILSSFNCYFFTVLDFCWSCFTFGIIVNWKVLN